MTGVPHARHEGAPSPAVRVGVFDSGVGGLSVLRALHTTLPRARFHYVADSAHAPYGERSDAYVADRTLRIADHLLTQGVQMLVVACNTATAVAVAAVRERWPEVPVVGVEPGLKPAVAASRNGRVGVMATPMTLRSNKFQRLMEAHGVSAKVHLQACPGLAGLIEQASPDSAELRQTIAQHTRPLVEFGADTVVLGCTHYPFVRDEIQSALGREVVLIDTAEAVARQTGRLLARLLPRPDGPSDAAVRLVTTGDAATLARLSARWLPFDCAVSAEPGI